MNFKNISFEHDPAQYIAPSWNDLDLLTFDLAKNILGKNEKYDLIVSLAKGAWPMSRSFVDFLGMDQLASLGVKFYSGINERLKEPSVYQDLPALVKEDLKGKKVLLFDDVADTGESLVFARDYLLESGAAEVKTATLFMKPRSIITPDFYGAETDAWIIFPFEVREMMTLLADTWQKNGKDSQEILYRFEKLSFPKEMISYLEKLVIKE